MPVTRVRLQHALQLAKGAAMKNFDEVFSAAAARKGGGKALDAMLTPVKIGQKTPKQIAKLGDDRLLAEMTRRVFQAGFNWSVIDNKWDGFEAAFEGFPVGRWTLMSDEDLDRLLADTGIVRHATKIQAVGVNARFLQELAAESGSAAKAIAEWPDADYVGLLELFKKRGARMGGSTCQYFLRGIGKSSFVLSSSVVAALIAHGVVDKAPTSKSALVAVQGAFNQWSEESGRSLTQISRVLAMSVDV